MDNPEPSKPGPDPERLKLDREDWEDAIGDALARPRPKDGWPKDGGPSGDKPDEGSAADVNVRD